MHTSQRDKNVEEYNYNYWLKMCQKDVFIHMLHLVFMMPPCIVLTIEVDRSLE